MKDSGQKYETSGMAVIWNILMKENMKLVEMWRISNGEYEDLIFKEKCGCSQENASWEITEEILFQRSSQGIY